MAFIYMLDDGEAFRRVHFVKGNVVHAETDFWDELDYLVDNMTGV